MSLVIWLAIEQSLIIIIMMVAILESIINVGHTDYLVDPCVAEK